MCCDLRGQRGSPPALHLWPQFAFCSQAAWNFLSVLGSQQRGSWGSWYSFHLRLEVEGHCLSFQMCLLPHPLLLFRGSSAGSHTFSGCLDVRSGAWSSRPPSSVSTLFYPVCVQGALFSVPGPLPTPPTAFFMSDAVCPLLKLLFGPVLQFFSSVPNYQSCL